MDWDVDIDAEGLLCPLPVLRARKRLAAMLPGAVLRLRATDPASWVDVPHFCQQSGHQLLQAREQDGVRVYLIRRGE
jgi:tRNA 2-thiouridine synthesizing protein A